MVVETVKESLSVNKLIATKAEVILVEGDMIVPDSKPDILNTICTSGVVCIYKKEVLEGKVRIDGNINTYIMYIPDDENDKVRGITTTLDFSENIQIANVNEEIEASLNALQKLNSKIETSICFTLPFEQSNRTIIKIRKLLKTDRKFPRKYSDIKKRPL